MSLQQMIMNTIVIFIVIYILSRILGKKLISQMSFFDFVAGVSLGSIVGAAIFAPTIPIWKGSVSLIIVAVLTYILDLTSLKSFRGRKILNDEPALLIKDGKVLEQGMKKARLTIDDLLMLLRKKDIFYLDEIEFALFESDGTVSAIKKAPQQTPTNKDLQLPSVSRGLPQSFIIDGNILQNSLASIGKDENWVNEILLAHNILKIEDVSVAQIDRQMKIFISQK